MKPLLWTLRWALLAVSAAAALLCVVRGLTPGRALVVVSTGTVWYLLSRRKALSLDREKLGIPPRSGI
ncbi:MAG: hypothetical protein KGM24_09830 [Elusimicrobia bacterium]|nr:hypothetical protein [Elusimicrobiota bacterium]